MVQLEAQSDDDAGSGSRSESSGADEEEEETSAGERSGRGPLVACLLMSGCALFFSLMGLSVKLAKRRAELSAFSILVIRSALGLPLNIVALLVARHVGGARLGGTPAPWRAKGGNGAVWLATRTLAGFVSIIAEFFAFSRLSLATCMVILYSSPIFVALWAAILLGQPVRGMELVCIFVCLCGLLLEARPWESDARGGGSACYLAIMSSAVTAGLANVSLRALDGIPFYAVLHVFMVGTLALSIGSGIAMNNLSLPSSSSGAWVYLVLASAFAYAAECCITEGFARAGEYTTRVALFKFLTPIFSMVWGVVFLSEEVFLLDIVGACLVLGPAAVISIALKRDTQSTALATLPGKPAK